MSVDPRRAAIFLEVFAEAQRTARNLQSSLNRIAGLFPLTPEQMDDLDEDEKDRLDAFRVRFTDLQDVLGGKLFRSLLHLEEEEPESTLDILNQVEKRGIIASVDGWRRLRDIRNLLTHEYPRSAGERAEALSTAFREAPGLIETLQSVGRHVRDHVGVDVDVDVHEALLAG